MMQKLKKILFRLLWLFPEFPRHIPTMEELDRDSKRRAGKIVVRILLNGGNICPDHYGGAVWPFVIAGRFKIPKDFPEEDVRYPPPY